MSTIILVLFPASIELISSKNVEKAKTTAGKAKRNLFLSETDFIMVLAALRLADCLLTTSFFQLPTDRLSHLDIYVGLPLISTPPASFEGWKSLDHNEAATASQFLSFFY